MAPQLTISGKLHAPSLKRRLDRCVSQLEAQGLRAAVHERALGEYTHYSCALNDGETAGEASGLGELLRSSVARAVAEAIVRDIAPAIVAEQVRRLRPEYDESEVASVVALAERGMAIVASEETLSSVAESVLDCLGEQESLNVDGFVRFRLPNYRRRLQACVKDAVRRYEAGREQQEFITLLRYLVDHQESSVDELHIYPHSGNSGNSFEMRDQNGSSVDSEYLEAYVWDLASEGGVDPEDLLISAVVSLAPGKVHWHLDRTAWKSPLLEAILDGRLVYCTGCDRCAPALY